MTAQKPLHFGKWVQEQMTGLADRLGTSVESEVLDHVDGWVSCHAKDTHTDTLQVIVPRGHQYWTPKVQQKVEKTLKYFKNAAGRPLKLEVVPA